MVKSIRFALIAFLFLGSVRQAESDVLLWSNPVGGDFDVNANWQGGIKPTHSDEAFFSLDSTYEVRFNNDEVSALATVDVGRVTFALQGHTYELESTSWITDGRSLAVGQRQGILAELTITNGTLSAHSVVVSGSRQNTEPGPGILRVGAGAKLITTEGSSAEGGLMVGKDEVGKMYVTDGGIVESVDADLGNANSDRTGNGYAEVNGIGSRWTLTRQLYFGRAEDTPGTLVVKNGGYVSASAASVGYIATSTGNLTVQDPGSVMDVGPDDILIGFSGSGVVEVLNGGLLHSRSGIMSVWQNSSGTAFVRGPNSRWVNDADLQVGRMAPASIEVSDGGTFQTSTISVGPGNTGVLQLSGMMSSAKVLQSMTIGGSFPISQSTVRVQDGATLSIGQSLVMRQGSSIDVSGGLVRIGNSAVPQTGEGLYIVPTGTLSGTGTVNTKVENEGNISPGQLTITGDFQQSEFGSLQFQVSRFGSIGNLHVDSEAMLQGELKFSLATGFFATYQPKIGDAFHFLVAEQGVIGTFERVNLPPLPADRKWSVRYQANDVSLLVLAGPAIAGDYNNNGMVDAADYTIWRNTVGSLSDFRADATGPDGVPDQIVDSLDFEFWKLHYGEISSSGPATASELVPEPSSMLLSFVAVIGICSVVRKRTRCTLYAASR